jgi:hypothetical protein
VGDLDVASPYILVSLVTQAAIVVINLHHCILSPSMAGPLGRSHVEEGMWVVVVVRKSGEREACCVGEKTFHIHPVSTNIVDLRRSPRRAETSKCVERNGSPSTGVGEEAQVVVFNQDFLQGVSFFILVT